MKWTVVALTSFGEYMTNTTGEFFMVEVDAPSAMTAAHYAHAQIDGDDILIDQSGADASYRLLIMPTSEVQTIDVKRPTGPVFEVVVKSPPASASPTRKKKRPAPRYKV